MKRNILISLIALGAVVCFFLGSLLLPPAFRPDVEYLYTPPAAENERVVCIDDNTDALIWRLRMIQEAREELVLTTFGFGTGQAGQDICAALLDAADRGVDIRILLDGYNGKKAVKNSDALRSLAALPNVELRLYNPVNLLKPWVINYRMHDKYLIVDHNMYLLGGRNTNDLFLGDYSDSPNIDRDILVCNSSYSGSLLTLKAYFEDIWELPECKLYETEENLEDTRVSLRRRFEELKSLYPTAFGFTDWESATLPAAGVTVLTGGTEAKTKAPTLWKQLCQYMAQGEDVTIQTPYIVCGREMYQDLFNLTQRAKITILTNSPETGANPFGSVDLRGQRKKILRTGATLLEYAGDHSLHAKAVLIDDDISIIGSFNTDMRSAYLDTETMVVIDCPELNAQLRSQMDAMTAQSLQTAPDGTETPGPAYEKGELSFWRATGYNLLSLVLWLGRHLL